jgi:transposase InsO family protein
MITDKAKHKARVLAFWDKHGRIATEDAFGVTKKTLYNWKNQLKTGDGKLESLNDKSKRPKTIRSRRFEWPEAVKSEIKRLRKEHPNLGKDKIYPLLLKFCNENNLSCPKPATIGNLIKDMGGLRIFPVKVRHNGKIVPKKRKKRARKPKDFKALYPGHCGSFDTIERIIHGSRRYIITFTDLYSRFSLAWATNSHASQAAKEFFDMVRFLFPFKLDYVLTDNGSEFMKHFDEALKKLCITHWHTYPKTPKMNAHAERFNRTIQEEYIDYHEFELLDATKFNIGLMKQLLWHNIERPHHSLGNIPPAQFIQNTNYFPEKCNMYLTYTLNCN